ncbi:hypothetical protein [Oceaniglobus indicus]|uniref:hypothetical protein n=1 Tax=Oceaniglobus indicus TaxID=2047749 RepID=UPI000C18505A|nr:hypothetical protein [Oceaniglobus indicus]
MTHREFEGWAEFGRRLKAATDAGSPDWARLPPSERIMHDEGGRHYFTGRPCNRGHVSPRDANRCCTQCNVANMRAFYDRKKHAV